MEVNKTNFYENTTALFINVEARPSVEPDYISFKKSYIDYEKFLRENGLTEIDFSFEDFKKLPNEYHKISSVYWYTEKGVFRQSDHWGSVSSCEWNITNFNGEILIGYCDWDEFNIEINYRYFDTKLYDIKRDDEFKSFKQYIVSMFRGIQYLEDNEKCSLNDLKICFDRCIKGYIRKYKVTPSFSHIKEVFNYYKKYTK